MTVGGEQLYCSITFRTPEEAFASGGSLTVMNGILMILTAEGWVEMNAEAGASSAALRGADLVTFQPKIIPSPHTGLGLLGPTFSIGLSDAPGNPNADDQIYIEIEEEA